MSLVNDALKRAKDAQTKAPAPGPQFRPAEPVAPAVKGMSLIVPVAIGFIALVGLILVLQNRQKTVARESAPKPAAAAAAVPIAKPVAVSTPAPAPAAPVPAAAAEKSAPATVSPVNVPAPVLKLKAIFYSPGHSTAIINGKTVKAGDIYKGFRVAAITQTSATLVSATQTNVMTLEPD